MVHTASHEPEHLYNLFYQRSNGITKEIPYDFLDEATRDFYAWYAEESVIYISLKDSSGRILGEQGKLITVKTNVLQLVK